MLLSQGPRLYLSKSESKGRSVFTCENIPTDSLIEICPVIILSAKDLAIIKKTILHNYYFLWGEDRQAAAIALGYGSLYNHSATPNARFEIDLIEDEIRFLSIRKIDAGEEITISYTDPSYKEIKLWFDPA